MCLILIFILGTISAAFSAGSSLDCTNDYEDQMLCQFEAQNCSQHNLTLLEKEVFCIFQKCDTGCCCSVSLPFSLVTVVTYIATVWKGGELTESKVIDITASTKPKTPTNISVEETNGNYRVKWNTNTNRFFKTLTANVTYYKKGDTGKVFNHDEEKCSYEIPGRKLEPSTTYVVSVKSYLDWSGKFSDSSEEREFITAASPHTLTWGIIVSLSVAAIIINAFAFGCYTKVKTKWLGTFAKCPKPKLFDVHAGTEKILQPLQTSFSSVCIDPAAPYNNQLWSDSGSPQQHSGFSAGSSPLACAGGKPADIKAGVQGALSKVYTNILSLTPMATSLPTESNQDCGLFSAHPGSTDFDNKTYWSCFGVFQHHMSEVPEAQTQAEMVCESAYHHSESDSVTCPDQPVLHMPTDMSYQQCGYLFRHCTLSSISAATNKCCSLQDVRACDDKMATSNL